MSSWRKKNQRSQSILEINHPLKVHRISTELKFESWSQLDQLHLEDRYHPDNPVDHSHLALLVDQCHLEIPVVQSHLEYQFDLEILGDQFHLDNLADQLHLEDLVGQFPPVNLVDLFHPEVPVVQLNLAILEVR